MFRPALPLAALLAFAAIAHAMPSDLPWQPYDCKDGKALKLKFLSDGIAIAVLIGDDETQAVTTAPIDEEKQAGFKPGNYKGEGDFVLTIAEDGVTVGVSGADVAGGPYDACRPRHEAR